MNTHTQEVSLGQRFGFGKNWERFLRTLNDERIHEAERSLGEMLQMEKLAGKSFLDVGSGSGLFSLAAMRLGAERVHSFDYDPHSVGCTKELKRRFLPPPTKIIGRLRKAVFSMLPICPGSESSTSFTRGACCITQETCGGPWRM
jgi:hypothetical protein